MNKIKSCVVGTWFCKIGFFSTLVLVFGLNALSEDIRIGRTSMKIGCGSSVVFKSNVSVFEDAIVNNDGDVFFKNKNVATLDVNTIINGNGVYHITGIADYSVIGNGGAVSTLSVESGKKLNIDKDFSITKKIHLESGIVDVADNSKLIIQNPSTDAIDFYDDFSCKDFIEGTLYRNVVSGSSYTYPLGSSIAGYHPMVINNVTSSGYIGINYLEGFAQEWNAKNVEKALAIEEIGGWQVKTEAESMSFSPMLSLYNSSGLVSGDFNILCVQNAATEPYTFSLNYNSKINDECNYLCADTTKYHSGFFAVNKNSVIDNENPDTEAKKFVNFIVANGSGRSRFEVPGISNYKKVVLKVYDRSGNLVYKNELYANDFETRRYRPGTYYYELLLITDTEEQILVRDFIEVIRRN